MKLNIFTKDNCDFCAQVQIPEGINVSKINIDSGEYHGFLPATVPVIQVDGLNFEGPFVINSILKLVKESQDGNYKG